MLNPDILNDLIKYADIEGTEIGEVCILLTDIARYPDYVSEEFYHALEKEIMSQLKYFKENSEIVEREETFTRKMVELAWR